MAKKYAKQREKREREKNYWQRASGFHLNGCTFQLHICQGVLASKSDRNFISVIIIIVDVVAIFIPSLFFHL